MGSFGMIVDQSYPSLYHKIWLNDLFRTLQRVKFSSKYCFGEMGNFGMIVL